MKRERLKSWSKVDQHAYNTCTPCAQVAAADHWLRAIHKLKDRILTERCEQGSCHQHIGDQPTVCPKPGRDGHYQHFEVTIKVHEATPHRCKCGLREDVGEQESPIISAEERGHCMINLCASHPRFTNQTTVKALSPAGSCHVHVKRSAICCRMLGPGRVTQRL